MSPSNQKYPTPEIGVFSDEEWATVAPALFKKIAEGEQASISKQPTRTAQTNINGHDLKRVAK